MTYATRKARIREWIKADAERRQRDEIARRVAEELCPPPKLRVPETGLGQWSKMLAKELASREKLLKEIAAYKPRPHDDMVDAFKYVILK